jgi:hypothetical protein
MSESSAAVLDRQESMLWLDLTEAQRSRWDQAMAEYDQVFRRNAERTIGRALTDAQWAAERGSPAFQLFRSYQPGHMKSALFRRLLDGKPALPFAPPCSFSYPWYEVIESDAPIDDVQVAFAGECGLAMSLAEHGRKQTEVDGAIGVVQIQQAIWCVLEREGDDAIVTCGEWAAAGWRWRLRFIELPASENTGLYCTHDPGKAWLSTADDLRRECEHRTKLDVELLQAVAQGQPLPEHATKGWDETMHGLIRAQAQRRIDVRLAAGLSPVPGPASLRRRVRKLFKHYLHHSGDARPRYRIDAQGRIVKCVWRIERIPHQQKG